MAIYTVLAPATRVGDAPDDPLRPVFIKDGFSWPAFLIALPWMLYRRMWLVLIGYIVVAMAVALLLSRASDTVITIVMVLLSLLFALEANNLRRWTLERRRYSFLGVAEGRNIEEAEIRFFSEQARAAAMPVSPAPPAPPAPPAGRVPVVAPRAPTPPSPPAAPRPWQAQQPSAEAGDVVGLFPAPAAPKGQS